jgi:hypothetical protein
MSTGSSRLARTRVGYRCYPLNRRWIHMSSKSMRDKQRIDLPSAKEKSAKSESWKYRDINTEWEKKIWRRRDALPARQHALPARRDARRHAPRARRDVRWHALPARRDARWHALPARRHERKRGLLADQAKNPGLTRRGFLLSAETELACAAIVMQQCNRRSPQ